MTLWNASHALVQYVGETRADRAIVGVTWVGLIAIAAIILIATYFSSRPQTMR